MIPLINSLSYGPLCVCQLPRFWWKALLRKAGWLDEEYPDCSGGLDTAVLNVLNLDKEETLSYLREERPNYLRFEDWVLEQKGGTIDREAVEQWNAHLRVRVHTRPEKIAETYRDIGLPDDAGIASATLLNCLQDWQLFYKRDLNGDFSAFDGKVTPLISTLDVGPVGICQVPRTWLKNLLHAKGLLHPDYPHMTENGLDPRALRVVDIEPDAAVAHIHENLPTCLQFAEWIFRHGRVDRERIEEWNAYLRGREHHEGKRAEIYATVGRDFDGKLTSAVVLNHIEDWHYAYTALRNNL